MISVKEAIDQIGALLARRISLEQFEDWSASFAQSAYRRNDAAAVESVLSIRSIVNAFADDSSEDSLRRELANAIRPFVQQARVSYPSADRSAIYEPNTKGATSILKDNVIDIHIE